MDSHSNSLIELREWTIERAKTIERVDKTVQMIAEWKDNDGSVITFGLAKTSKGKEVDEGESSQMRT